MKNSLLPFGTITKKVKVDRLRTNQEAINATNRTQYVNPRVLERIPRCIEEEVEIFFIPYISVPATSIEDVVNKIGLKLADPISVCAVNEQDPTFADIYRNGTQWRDEHGQACAVIFSRNEFSKENNKRNVYVVRQHAFVSGDTGFVACVRIY